MYLQEEARTWLIALTRNPASQQLLPLLVVLLFPLVLLKLVRPMVLELFSWNWSSGSSSPKKLRTRAGQLQANKPEYTGDDGRYPGLVNTSGTYCFMNSTLQAMASLSYLQPHLAAIHAKAEALDVPSPVIDALQALLQSLNSPKPSASPIRPVEILAALSNTSQSSLFSSREHQDAQELFQLLSECIKSETAAVDKEAYRDRGLGGLKQPGETSRETGKGVFDGLTANRRSCVECGYTEAVMHFAFDSWQLALPRAASCSLEDCLTDYTRLELLHDCICRKCSMVATHKRLVDEANRLTQSVANDAGASVGKKKRAREARKLELRVKTVLEQGRIEEDVKDVKMEKVFSRVSTKQAMIARPPPVLALHLNRSVHYGQYASKNGINVLFPEILDLTPFTTSGNLSTVPSVPISSPPPAIPRSTTPTPASYGTPRIVYRLDAVVCHYGQHSFGHYVCFRRKPKPPSAGVDRFAPPRLAHPANCDCDKCESMGLRTDDSTKPGRGWLRISDDSVAEVGLEAVLMEGKGAFMLYYERIQQPRPTFTPRDSTETLRPEMKVSALLMNGSVGSMRDEGGKVMSVVKHVANQIPRGPGRIVRSVQPGRPKAQNVEREQELSDSLVLETGVYSGGADTDLTPKQACPLNEFGNSPPPSRKTTPSPPRSHIPQRRATPKPEASSSKQTLPPKEPLVTSPAPEESLPELNGHAEALPNGDADAHTNGHVSSTSPLKPSSSNRNASPRKSSSIPVKASRPSPSLVSFNEPPGSQRVGLRA